MGLRKVKLPVPVGGQLYFSALRRFLRLSYGMNLKKMNYLKSQTTACCSLGSRVWDKEEKSFQI